MILDKTINIDDIYQKYPDYEIFQIGFKLRSSYDQYKNYANRLWSDY